MEGSVPYDRRGASKVNPSAAAAKVACTMLLGPRTTWKRTIVMVSNSSIKGLSGGGYHVGAHAESLLEDANRLGVPFTSDEPRTAYYHGRGLPRFYSPGSSTGWDDAEHRAIFTSAHTIASVLTTDTPAGQISYGPGSGGSAQHEGTTMPVGQSSVRLPHCHSHTVIVLLSGFRTGEP
ncbi:hypothetical protein BHM03_00017509 [Ensete ventricosum]|nr:hypothetical protein BHM03_00017509 [Ensete ventricosum]